MAWEVRKLGDHCNIIGGGTPSKSTSSFYNGKIPWATVRDMKKEWLDTTEFKISEEAVRCSSTNVIEKGNVVIATRVGLGKVCILQQDTAINQDLKAVIPKDGDLNKLFLFWYLKSISHEIEEAGVGATVKGVKLTFIKNLKIPLPPLSEQKRIVAILDKAFADIDKIRENTQKNLKNVQELFESYLEGVFSQQGEGWVYRHLGDHCNILGGGTPSKSKSNFYNGKIPWATVRDMKKERLDATEFKISEEAVRCSSTNVIDKGNVVIATRVGLGKVCILQQDTAINQDLKAVIPKDGELDKLFLFWFLKGISHEIQQAGVGATVKGVKLTFIKNLKIPIPPLTEQKSLVEKFEEIKRYSVCLEQLYNQKLSLLSSLKKSLLHSAFTGQLTQHKTHEEIAA